jgi:hypothetical protein
MLQLCHTQFSKRLIGHTSLGVVEIMVFLESWFVAVCGHLPTGGDRQGFLFAQPVFCAHRSFLGATNHRVTDVRAARVFGR